MTGFAWWELVTAGVAYDGKRGPMVVLGLPVTPDAHREAARRLGLGE